MTEWFDFKPLYVSSISYCGLGSISCLWRVAIAALESAPTWTPLMPSLRDLIPMPHIGQHLNRCIYYKMPTNCQAACLSWKASHQNLLARLTVMLLAIPVRSPLLPSLLSHTPCIYTYFRVLGPLLSYYRLFLWPMQYKGAETIVPLVIHYRQ